MLKHPLVATIVASGALLALAAPALQHAHGDSRASTTFPKSIPGGEGVRRDAGLLPGRRHPRARDGQGRQHRRPRVSATAIAELRHDAVATGQFHEPDLGEGQPERDDRAGVYCRSRAPVPTRRRTRALETLRDDVIPQTCRLAQRCRRRRRRPGRQLGTTSTQQMKDAGCRSCSRSCSRSPSSCC